MIETIVIVNFFAMLLLFDVVKVLCTLVLCK